MATTSTQKTMFKLSLLYSLAIPCSTKVIVHVGSIQNGSNTPVVDREPAIKSVRNPFPGCDAGSLVGCPGTADCTVASIVQPIDHFNWGPPLGGNITNFTQRYFYTDKYWSTAKNGSRGPIFFYFGNEDNVELYVNHTGLMWENAQQFGAKLVFAEHRYYGTSVPFQPKTAGCMNFLTTEQAMADFAFLIDFLRQLPGASDSAVIGFGGSYGGMVAAWFRMHYPASVDGVIAASAPIWSFHGLDPAYNYNGFDQAVTDDLVNRGSQACRDNLKDAWNRIVKAGTTPQGLASLTTAFLPCTPPKNKFDALDIVNWAAQPWGYYAMGNYPYRSTYMLHGKAFLPAYPLDTNCELFLPHTIPSDADLFARVKLSVDNFYNATGDKSMTCYNIPMGGGGSSKAGTTQRFRGSSMPSTATPFKEDSLTGPLGCVGDWGYQWCTEMHQPFVQGTDEDAFYCSDGSVFAKDNCSDAQRFDFDSAAVGCQIGWGVVPNKDWAKVMLASKKISAASNIVFSNGALDPWHPGGVLNNVSDTVVAILIENGAHHIDLMFSDDADTADIKQARNFEVSFIKTWINQVAARNTPMSE